MKLYRSLDAFPDRLRGGAVAIGNFDGVHRGHARIVRQLIAQAGKLDGAAIAFTFDPHPVRLLRPDDAPSPLTWTDRKAQLLGALGVDAVIAYPTDTALLALSPEEFFETIVLQRLAARAVVEGPNFFFGKDRTGDILRLAQLCESYGVALEIVDSLVEKGQIVSSSRVRTAIQQGHVETAAELLTQPYRIRGIVTHGAGRGGKIGFPTANIEGIDTLLPAPGVYAGRAWTSATKFGAAKYGAAESASTSSQPAALNIGPNPTFGEHALKVEAHLLDYQGSLYGETLEVELLERIRDVQPFSTIEALQLQLKRDVQRVRQVLTPT